MNTYYLVLKGSNKGLATTEFETLFNTYYDESIKLEKIENTMYKFSSNKILDSKELLHRLTFTNYIGLKIEKEDFSKYEGKSFRVRIKKSRKDLDHKREEKEIAELIWDVQKNPKVDLETPQVEFNLLINEEEEVYCVKIFENDKDYLRRMPKERPIAMPFTLKSDMARAAINLLGIKEGIVLDPFCGIGGILLEAKDMKFETIGNDLSWRDLQHLKTNWAHYFPNTKPNLIIADCKTQFLNANSVDGIVTDIPYGKSSQKLGVELYEDFLKHSSVYLKDGRRMIVIFANFVDFKPLVKKYFKEIQQIDEYINKSMTRHILILEKK
jgi:tRNA (guanine10-N2)-dimethyltransferase